MSEAARTRPRLLLVGILVFIMTTACTNRKMLQIDHAFPGIRDSFARPRGGRVDFAIGPSAEIPDRELKTVRETSTFARAGIDLRWSEKSRVTLSGEYGERGSWSARFGVGFALGSTRPPAPLQVPEPMALTVVKPCRFFCRIFGRRIDRTECSTAPDGLSHSYTDIEIRYRFFRVTGSSVVAENVTAGPCP